MTSLRFWCLSVFFGLLLITIIPGVESKPIKCDSSPGFNGDFKDFSVDLLMFQDLSIYFRKPKYWSAYADGIQSLNGLVGGLRTAMHFFGKDGDACHTGTAPLEPFKGINDFNKDFARASEIWDSTDWNTSSTLAGCTDIIDGGEDKFGFRKPGLGADGKYVVRIIMIVTSHSAFENGPFTDRVAWENRGDKTCGSYNSPASQTFYDHVASKRYTLLPMVQKASIAEKYWKRAVSPINGKSVTVSIPQTFDASSDAYDLFQVDENTLASLLCSEAPIHPTPATPTPTTPTPTTPTSTTPTPTTTPAATTTTTTRKIFTRLTSATTTDKTTTGGGLPVGVITGAALGGAALLGLLGGVYYWHSKKGGKKPELGAEVFRK